eukprot:1147134-Pelagomonas_calceolata.AAC.2
MITCGHAGKCGIVKMKHLFKGARAGAEGAGQSVQLLIKQYGKNAELHSSTAGAAGAACAAQGCHTQPMCRAKGGRLPLREHAGHPRINVKGVAGSRQDLKIRYQRKCGKERFQQCRLALASWLSNAQTCSVQSMLCQSNDHLAYD